MLKRKRNDENTITHEFIQSCDKKFKKDPANLIAKNAINTVGTLAITNSNRVNQISHIFLNSVKRKNLRATNQGASGRCWMFAALNVFRHLLINAIDLDDFEFSEVYLFFWDKFERSNSYLNWFINNPDKTPEDKSYEYMLENYMSDGGWWNTFSNLVSKYGLVPLSAMKETYQSDDSEEMNKVIKEKLDSTINYIRLNKLSTDELNKLRLSTLNIIYNILVKFLGEPPQEFTWHFSHYENIESNSIGKLTPKKFADMVMDGCDDFVILSHIPDILSYYTKYTINNTNNVQEGKECTIFNVPIHELAKAAMKSISEGIPVWFAGDVNQGFNWIHSCLDDKLEDKTPFGDNRISFSKGDRILLRNVQGNHAMVLTGFNLVSPRSNKILNWQVENSWGYYDNETPGLDGFLNMSHSWFEKYVIQIAVNKNFLSRTLLKKLEKEAIRIDPWTCVAPAVYVKGQKLPFLKEKMRRIRNNCTF